MKELTRCKACNYVFDNSKDHDVCPACGVGKAAFEPYKFRISEKRAKLIDLHLHPIILHFPQALIMINLLLLILLYFVGGDVGDDMRTILTYGLYLLPLTVIAGFVSGIIDGKARFKKVSTPLLKRKIIFGSTFVGVSLVQTILLLAGISLDGGGRVIQILLTLVSVGCAALLGRMGAPLMDAKMPG